MDFIIWMLRAFSKTLDTALYTVFWALLVTLLMQTVYLLERQIGFGNHLVSLKIKGKDTKARLSGKTFHNKVNYLATAFALLLLWSSIQLMTNPQVQQMLGALEQGLIQVTDGRRDWWVYGTGLISILYWIGYWVSLSRKKSMLYFGDRGLYFNNQYLLWQEITSVTLEPDKLRIKYGEGLLVFDCEIDRALLGVLRENIGKKVLLDYNRFLTNQ